MMTDTWTWATVTQASPLRIKVDGDTSALDATTDNLVGSLAVLDRVRVHLHSDGIIVTGIQGGGNRSNPNLLINSDFMVNQEGNTSGATIADNAYLFDQWKHVSGYSTSAITWSDTGGVRTVTLGISGQRRQIREIIEQADITAGTYTLSWPGTVLGRVYNAGATEPAYAASPTTVTLDGTANVNVDLQGEGDTIEGWVKLERGPVATPYQPPRYDDNLRACMRYYQRFSSSSGNDRYGNGFFASSTQTRITMSLLAPMRTSSPTLTYNDLRLYEGSTAYTATSLTLASANGSQVGLNAAVSGATQYRPCYLLANSTASFLAFDARL